MKIMNEYTYQQIKKNKRHAISILVAITIASALLCSLCIVIYSYWQGKILTVKENTGDWHGELWDTTYGDKLNCTKSLMRRLAPVTIFPPLFLK